MHWLALFLMGALLLAACGEDDDDTAGEEDDSAGASEDGGDGEDGGEAGEPTSGGSVTVLSEIDTDTMDPPQLTSTQAARMITHAYDTLVAQTYDMSEIRPLLAEDWSISDDGLELEFQIRDDVEFHSGHQLTASDVVASLERLSEESMPGSHYVGSVETFEAVDDYTVLLTLEAPDNFLLENLSKAATSILSEEAIEEWGDDLGTTAEAIDGTGPFEVVEWLPGDSMTMQRFDTYEWGPEGVHENTGPAHIEELIWREVPEASTRAASLQAGEAHIAQGGLLQHADELESAESVEVVVWDILNTQHGAFKIAKPELEEVEVRQALNHAVDKQALIDTAQGGFGVPAYGYLHPNTEYYWEGLEDVAYEHDPARAEELLDEAGWELNGEVREKDGLPLSLEVYAGLASEEELTLVQADYAAIGVELNLNLVDRTALYDIRRGEEPDINWIWLPFENADILRERFHSENLPAPNRHNFDDPEADELFETALTSQDDEEVEEAFHEAQRIIHEQALVLPLYHRQELTAHASQLQGLDMYLQYSIGQYKSLDIWLDE